MIDVLVVGAGPAGLSAAINCAEHGLKVKVVDEFIKPGGRLLGQLHEEPNGEWWNGIKEANDLYQRAIGLGVDVECGVSVYNLEHVRPMWRVYTTNEIIEVSNLVLATGAAETSVPIPGWTLPGVMSIGAAQVMTNVQRVKVGQKGVVVGVNVLSVAITRELQIAGINVTGMMLPEMNLLNRDAGDPNKVFESLLRVSHLAPSKLIRFGSKLMKNKALRKMGVKFYPKGGFKMWGMPIHLRSSVVEILGESQVEAVRTVKITSDGLPIPGTERVIPVDFVCIAGGLYPLVELASVAGCPFRFVPELGGHVPLHNRRMETPLKGLYVAGNITGIESAKVAMAQGNVAGLSIAQNMKEYDKQLQKKLRKAIQNVDSTRSQALIQFDPNIIQGRINLEKQWHEQTS